MSLRNELRQPLTNFTLYEQSYNWQDWYKYMKQGAAAINSKNPNLLIFLSGIDSDATLQPVVEGTALTPGTGTFSLDDFQGYSNKLVLEIHAYEILSPVTNCTLFQSQLATDGFEALNASTTSKAKNAFPVIMTEFGFTEDATTWQDVYASCLEAYLPAQKAGWMIWALGGSYYIREGTQDSDETWGLLTHDWSDWRSPEHINGGLTPMIKASLAAIGS